jgi:hypothetical protein
MLGIEEYKFWVSVVSGVMLIQSFLKISELVVTGDLTIRKGTINVPVHLRVQAKTVLNYTVMQMKARIANTEKAFFGRQWHSKYISMITRARILMT